jgi:hypothetical protein
MSWNLVFVGATNLERGIDVRGRPRDSLISTSYLVCAFISFLCSHFHHTILVTPPFVVVLVSSLHISFLGHVSDDYVCCPDLVVIIRLGSDRYLNVY